MSGDAGCSLAWHMQDLFSRRPWHCWVGEDLETVAHRVGPWINLGSAFESAGMQGGKQAKHTAVSRRLGYPDSVQAVRRQASFVA